MFAEEIVHKVWAADEPRAVDAKRNPSLATVIREEPFVNSLGMKFVPVPITGGPTDGQRLLFSIWEARVQDYAAFARNKPAMNSGWKDVECEGEIQEPSHPVVNVSWEDANVFCAWLTKKEREAGLMDSHYEYRLPTDHEWSCAIGIGDKEEADASPADKNGNLQDFPWEALGEQWPPPSGFGNYAGEEAQKCGCDTIDGYRDPCAFTAPVGSFKENSLGLFDLSGNVWEWCEDWYDHEQKSRVLRGGSWMNLHPEFLQSATRFNLIPGDHNISTGFRCVISAVGRLSAP